MTLAAQVFAEDLRFESHNDRLMSLLNLRAKSDSSYQELLDSIANLESQLD